MTKLLEKAIKKVKVLPEEEQDNIARIILNEVAWIEVFKTSGPKLDLLRNGISTNIKNGKFRKIDY